MQVDLVDQAKIRPAAKFEVAGNDIRIKHLVKVINQEVCNNNFSYHMFSRKENFHEFVPASVSKEQSLRFLANHLNLSTRNLVAIGNGNNDIGMLKMANPGVAVANASLKVKASAQYVTSTWYRNGVKKMLEKEHLV